MAHRWTWRVLSTSTSAFSSFLAGNTQTGFKIFVIFWLDTSIASLRVSYMRID